MASPSHLFTSLFACALLVAMTTLSACGSPPLPEGKRNIWIEGKPFSVEVASDDATRAQGLMNRTELPEGTGMLFVWSDNAPRSFWMKNTLIPLDIIYFRHDEVLDEAILDSWTTAQPCKVQHCPGYPSQGAVQYVVELPAGSVERYGWRSGARLDFKEPAFKKTAVP